MDEPTAEQWRPVPGTDGWYDVSDQGRVRSWKKYKSNQWVRLGQPFIYKTGTTDGYKVFRYKGKTIKVHRAVMAAFVGPCPEGLVVCHWNDIRADNRLTNLRYGSRAENRKDAVRNNRMVDTPKKTHCVNGHPLEEGTVRWVPDSTNRHGKSRKCKQCSVEADRRYRKNNPLTPEQRARKTEMHRLWVARNEGKR